MDLNCSQYHLLERLLFLHWIDSTFWSKINWPYIPDLFLYSLLLHQSACLSWHQCHIILISWPLPHFAFSFKFENQFVVFFSCPDSFRNFYWAWIYRPMGEELLFKTCWVFWSMNTVYLPICLRFFHFNSVVFYTFQLTALRNFLSYLFLDTYYFW